MAAVDVDRVCAEAQRRWPALRWPAGEYRRHLGSDNPAHPVDLYLAGAAANRLGEAWTIIEEGMASPARTVLRRQAMADYTDEELWRDAVARLMAGDEQYPRLGDGSLPARIIRYRGMVKLLHYFIVIARRIAISRQRQRRPALSLAKSEEQSMQIADSSSPAPDLAMRESEAVERLGKAVEAAFGALAPEQQFLLTMVYRQGMKQKEAGAILGWSESKASRALSAALLVLRGALAEAAGVGWTPALAAAWEGCLAACWKDVQVPPGRASEPLASRVGERA